MKTDIIIAGVGGQGILSIATVIGAAAVNMKLNIKQSEVHGMSQRGGAVYSHLRLSDKEIASDLIPLGKADLTISTEPMEALRYLPFMSPTGWLVTNTQPFVNISNYPDINSVLNSLKVVQNHVLIDADTLARASGNIKTSNMIMLGAATPFLNIDIKELENAVAIIFAKKGENIVETNIQALNAGFQYATQVCQ